MHYLVLNRDRANICGTLITRFTFHVRYQQRAETGRVFGKTERDNIVTGRKKYRNLQAPPHPPPITKYRT